MSHLDEGTLHALLDGELDLAEVSEIQGHLGSCVACGARLQEVKQFLAESDRLVAALEVPAGPAISASAAESPRPRAARNSPPPSTPHHEPDPWESPVILLPDANDALAGRKRWLKALRWAAMIAVVVGGGRFLLSAIQPGNSLPRDPEISSTASSVRPAVASPQELHRQETLVTKAENKPARPAAQRRAPVEKAAPQPKVLAIQPAVDSAKEPVDSATNASADTAAPEETLAAAGAVDSVSTESVLADSGLAASASKDTRRDSDEATTRRAAAAALAELDVQRRRERAAAATAALPPVRSNVQPAAEAPPPAPRTPEQRAQIYLRIGLDEASKQLGRPLHVIEGMTPQLIGLVQGRLVAGADPNRPVVRVVYLDTRGRMILLDQQRLKTGQTAGAAEGNLRWTVGDVMLYLRGEPSPDVLRSLQKRVR
jgi:putative zinc finger protein